LRFDFFSYDGYGTNYSGKLCITLFHAVSALTIGFDLLGNFSVLTGQTMI
jgi:hypothetical protein